MNISLERIHKVEFGVRCSDHVAAKTIEVERREDNDIATYKAARLGISMVQLVNNFSSERSIKVE